MSGIFRDQWLASYSVPRKKPLMRKITAEQVPQTCEVSLLFLWYLSVQHLPLGVSQIPGLFWTDCLLKPSSALNTTAKAAWNFLAAGSQHKCFLKPYFCGTLGAGVVWVADVPGISPALPLSSSCSLSVSYTEVGKPALASLLVAVKFSQVSNFYYFPSGSEKSANSNR